MGVTVLQHYPMTESKTGAQVIDLLTKRVIALGAVHSGQFIVDCETYTSVPSLGPQRAVHVLHNSEQPASVFSLLETAGTSQGANNVGGASGAVTGQSPGKIIPLVADALFDLLMMKMTNIYKSKTQTKVEARGPRFVFGGNGMGGFGSNSPAVEGDFLVKLGTITMASNFKGVLIEVEYRPCVIPSACWDMMREFLQGFLGSCVPSSPPQYLQGKMNDVYTPMDTIHQYLEQFTAYRKATGVR
ncbi:mediator of RNA polymerase II transcription subunit 20 isoform X2 [Hetaerina americana]|uniref:mediator of RNA polymerase II transcription subunit 20 isoform X2 n=1 Tax=Hetaerina americana TaxID=62018 RepID=UPI003A7F14F1